MKQYPLSFNAESKRYGYFNDHNEWREFASGCPIKLHYDFQNYDTTPEHDGDDCYRVSALDLFILNRVSNAYVNVER